MWITTLIFFQFCHDNGGVFSFLKRALTGKGMLHQNFQTEVERIYDFGHIRPLNEVVFGLVSQ